MLSDGRFILGLGASGPQVIEGFHGVPYDRPLQRTREIVDICRSAWRRERLEHDGKVYTLPLPPERGTGLGKPLKLITRPRRDRIPIYVAALGSKNVQMTAEIAEGWLPIFYMPERAKAVWGDDLAAGAAKRADDLPPLEIVAGGLVSIGADAAAARELARPMLGLYVGGMGARGKNFYNELVSRYGFEEEARKIQDLFLDGHRDEAIAAVPDELIEKTTLCGPASYVRERIEAFRESGVTVLNVTPVGGDVVGTIAQLKEWVG
jgi:F420-dependent oxidoreductase-like protein